MAIIAGITALDMAGVFSRRNRSIVTAGATAHHRYVVNPGYHCEIVGVMAILAGIQCTNMGSGFSKGYAPIVTTGAVPTDTGVIKYCARKTVCVMAVVTGVTTLNMARPFTGRSAAVMATGAAAKNRVVINSGDRRKIGRVVAIGTALCRSNMLYRLANDRYRPPWGMACRAFLGSALENPSNVATIAGQELVLTTEQKTALRVIKVGDLPKAHCSIA